MDLNPYNFIRALQKIISQVPRKQRITAVIILSLAGLGYCTIDKLPAIMHEAPAIIRAAKELPAPPAQADTTKLTALR
ncbi:hypothetical protein GCM10023172_42270 [Hymenobacter ginsengisoli]|uniref:Uncharacterized protein n=1 Tax=Hymenobacter ginsengisoli TaxID=1051626 RepID=A0ABP8QTC2_9BACT|nr:hypothetical protein [Hymenobacter sp. BT559]MBO2034022.1 hypothetical protein [Hymenobacter sp. BT559]